ncbi:DUF418 domain-containing protein [Brevibacterium album]|uniref:DUF418 domain-containing protein n=1 Tax=Brevibacterium album TaxID=417948 RepID=UPI00042380BC|nr:DUF418 domain-containing protein [Brevibacterium album]
MPHPAAHTTAPAQPTAPRRSLAPDIARGMMLLFIALANVSFFLWDRSSGLTNAHPTEGTILDRVLQALMMIMIDHRSVPMFAFLFGYGIVQFANSRLARGIPETAVRRMLRRRHWWMLAFGLIHAGLLFYGDVLGTYALTALVLMGILFRRSDRVLLVCSSIGLCLIGLVAALGVVGGALAAEQPGSAAAAGGGLGVADGREAAVGESSYPVSVLARLGIWAVLTPAQIIGLAIPVCVLLGWLAARHRLLDEPARHRRTLIRIAAFGIPIGWLGGLPGALAHTGLVDPASIGLPAEPGFMFFGLAVFTGIFTGIGYAALFGLIALRWQGAARTPAPLRALSATGQRSLTFYLWQSLVFAPLMAAWGLGLGAHMGTAAALGLALLVWLAGIGLAVRLDRRGRRGPAELLLRRLTYGSDDPVQPAASFSGRSAAP